MRTSRSDVPGPFSPGPPRTFADARVRAAARSSGWQHLAESTRAALAEFYDRSTDVDDHDFDEQLGELLEAHEDLQDLVHQIELSDDTGSDPRGVDMPTEEDPGPAGLPDPFATPDAQLLRQPQQGGDGQAAGNGGASPNGTN
ncbi:hypothetical protein ACF09C_07215 [Streptomyces sp. NPDC014870]|uniref:hypothetical protein n=1 Tax=Streptomyces sp. NPDC014870 TaxID=3364925 RepID=UPI0036F51A99